MMMEMMVLEGNVPGGIRKASHRQMDREHNALKICQFIDNRGGLSLTRYLA